MQKVLDEVFDHALVFHGFTPYMRDYELIVYLSADPRSGVEPSHRRLLFTKCVRATVTTSLTEEIWSRSLDDRLIDYDTGVELDGYVWGVNWQLLYPGGSVIDGSHDAAHWSQSLDETFHEVRIETNGHNLDLVFVDLIAETVQPGYAPFSLDDGPDAAAPLP